MWGVAPTGSTVSSRGMMCDGWGWSPGVWRQHFQTKATYKPQSCFWRLGSLWGPGSRCPPRAQTQSKSPAEACHVSWFLCFFKPAPLPESACVRTRSVSTNIRRMLRQLSRGRAVPKHIAQVALSLPEQAMAPSTRIILTNAITDMGPGSRRYTALLPTERYNSSAKPFSNQARRTCSTSTHEHQTY